MPMNKYGEIIRNSSAPPPISTGNNNGGSNRNSGGGIFIVIGVILLLAIIWFVQSKSSSDDNKHLANNGSNQNNDNYQITDNMNYDTNNEYLDSERDNVIEYDDYEDEEEEYEEDEEDSEYILPNSDSEYISKSDLSGLSQKEVQLARNEIFARRGREFDTDWIREYFESKSWYNPIYEAAEFDEMQESIFNTYERKNVKTIVAYEKKKGWR